MANILIRELDSTAYLNRQITNDNIVVVGGSHSTGSANAKEFVLCRSLREFYDNFGTAPLDNENQSDTLGWEYAANLIRAGFPVLYYSYYKGGTEGDLPVDLEKLGIIYSDDNIELLEDKIYYKIKFLPTIYEGTDIILSKIKGLAEARGDCLVFIDYNLGSADPSSENYTPVLAEGIKDTSYVSIASPTAYYDSPITGKEILMPASFWMLKTMAEGVSSGLPIWSIWAGSKRGRIRGVKRFSSRVSMQTMKRWTEIESIIPLMNIPPYGDLIYGNSTRLNVAETGSSKPPATRSALDSLNVRLVANEIKRAIFEICMSLSFDSNDMILWTEFKEKLMPILDGMKAGRGINDYLIIMDESVVTDQDIDQLTVPGIVRVDITRAAEKFDILFELTPTGAVFENL